MAKSKSRRKHVLVTNFNSNPNVGLYGYACDKYCLIGSEVPDSIVDDLKEVFNVPIIRTNIAGTALLGVFLSGNNNCLLVPKIAFANELETLDKHKIKYKLIDTKLTCLGNNIICNDNGCLVSDDYGEREIKAFKEALKVPVFRAKIAGHTTLGSLAVHTDKGLLCHHEVLEHEAKLLKKVLKVEIFTGTVNMGVPFVGSGILCNNNGFIIGDASGGPEIVNADESLGFLDN
ncbi:MAG TPA: translation initiation factor IF-6 [Alphaproteobacteria bacterium]|nr:translation initiation factor IF-6 [Alphaproteobacteria bacterium]